MARKKGTTERSNYEYLHCVRFRSVSRTLVWNFNRFVYSFKMRNKTTKRAVSILYFKATTPANWGLKMRHITIDSQTYCVDCGALLIKKITFQSFDFEKGNLNKYYKKVCPNRRFYHVFMFDKHALYSDPFISLFYFLTLLVLVGGILLMICVFK